MAEQQHIIEGDFIKPMDFDASLVDVITIDQWAEKHLTNSEYLKFISAKVRNDMIIEEAISSGLMKNEPVTELVFSKILNKNIPIIVGHRITIRDGEKLELDAEYMAFDKRYSESKDIVFNPVL